MSEAHLVGVASKRNSAGTLMKKNLSEGDNKMLPYVLHDELAQEWLQAIHSEKMPRRGGPKQTSAPKSPLRARFLLSLIRLARALGAAWPILTLAALPG